MKKITPKRQFIKDLAKEDKVIHDCKNFAKTGDIYCVNGSNFNVIDDVFRVNDGFYNKSSISY